MTHPVVPPSRGIRAREAAALAAITILPLFLANRGRLNADTKQYLYLDPVDLLERSRTLWDSRVGGGTVSHQAIGYLWPMGPYYAGMDRLGVPDWVAQRLWMGGLQLVAALGALALLRHLLPRSWVQVPAAAAYGLSPFVLGHITSQSGLLVPFAGLGWLVLLMARAVESPRSWRWPAAFALVVTTCGSLNGSSVFFVVLAAVLWVPFALRGDGRAARLDGLRVLVRAGVLTLLTQVWWLVAYAVGGRYNLPILDITETVRTTSATPSAVEVLRGLGYWFFYGGDTEGPWLHNLSSPYQTSGLLLVVSFGIPILALAAGAVVRWRHRAYFAALVGVGTVISVGAHPIGQSSPAGAAFERLSRTSDLMLSLRNTQRAAALVALGLAGLLAAGLTAMHRRHARAGGAAALALLVLVIGALPGQWRDGLIAERFNRGDDLPAAWREAGQALEAGTGRVLELPGSDFATYRWGATLDPVSVGLTDRPLLGRELVPLGGEAGADLLEALDRSLQEGLFEPAALSPVARLLGASDVLVRNDLAYERYRTVRPRVAWPLLSGPGTGLTPAGEFGAPYDNVAGPGRPMIDEIELGLSASADPMPQVALFGVPGEHREPLSALSLGGGWVVDGDGDGVVAAAAAGLLDGGEGALLLGADLVRAGDVDLLTDRTTRIVLTDTNRKRAKRWYSLRENAGATEPADHGAVLDDPSDARLEVAGTTPPGTQTVVEWRGVDRVWASAYGGDNTLVPEERPANAFDGDLTTAWRSERPTDGTRRLLGVELTEPSRAERITLVAPQDRLGTVTLTRVRVTLDGSRRIDVSFTGDEAARAEGRDVTLDGQPFRTLEVEVLDSVPATGLAGFAEVRIPGIQLEEVVVLPTALVAGLGERLAQSPLSIVFTRLRANPAEPLRADPEPSMRRLLQLPVALELEVSGTARIDTTAPDPVLDDLLGASMATWGVQADSTDRLAGALDARASSALDGDPATAWQTPFSTVEGQAVDIELSTPITLESLALEVVADGRHSLPSEIRLTADDVTIDLPVPAIASPAPDGSGVAPVRLPLPEPLTGSRWRLELTGVDIRSTTDWSTLLPFTLPVGLAEIDLPGVADRPETPVATPCRDDLLQVDGRPVPVRVSGDPGDLATNGGLAVAPCAGPVTLPSGPRLVSTTPGRRTGLAIDRLVLQRGDWSSPAPTPVAPLARTLRHEPGAVSGEVTSDGRPFWLVLDESMNEGWELEVQGATVEGPRPIDSSAAGWLVRPDRAGTLSVTARWGPQRTADAALAVSAAALAGCLVLVVVRRRSGPGRPAPRSTPTLEPVPPGPSWAAVAGGAAVAGLVVAPAAALAVGAWLAGARRWPWLGRAGPVVLVAGAMAAVTVLQVGHEYPASFVWPTRFPWVHQVALAAVVGLLALAVAGDGPDRSPIGSDE